MKGSASEVTGAVYEGSVFRTYKSYEIEKKPGNKKTAR